MSSNLSLLVQIAQLYYEQGKTQNEIASICKVERSRISRLLLEARKRGIVQFHVVDPSKSDDSLALTLKKTYDLQHAVVFNTLDVSETSIKQALGIVAGDFLSATLCEGDILAVSWGDSVFHTVQNLNPQRQINMTVVPAIGGSGILSESYMVNNLVERTANAFGGIYKSLYAPAFVDSPKTKEALVSSRDIEPILRLWDEASVALVGIGKSFVHGGTETAGSLQFGQFYFSRSEADELRAKDAAGDINAHFFNSAGEEQDADIHKRTIGMTLRQLKNVPKTIAVAGGIGKVEAIRSALLGGYINVLITDNITAQKLIESAER